jgi:integrase
MCSALQASIGMIEAPRKLLDQVCDALLSQRSRSVWQNRPAWTGFIALEKLFGVYELGAQLLYGSGLRLLEGLRLRVKNLDFAQHQMVVRDGGSVVEMLSNELDD